MTLDPASAVAFQRLYEQFGDLVYATAASILGDHQRAEDAFQEVFLRVATAIGRGVVPVYPVAWLLTITRRVSRRLLPRRSAAPLSPDIPAEAGPDPAVREEEDRQVRRALLSLDRLSRRLLLLAFLAGLDRREICTRLGLSRSAFFRRLADAKRRFMELMPGPRSGPDAQDRRDELS